jgi:hypothetical protein
MSSFRIWLKCIGWSLVYIGIVALVGFITINVYGYLQFRRAWHIGDCLSQDDFRQIAAACGDAEKEAEKEPYKYRSLNAVEIPVGFGKLHAQSAFFCPYSSQFVLYHVGEFKVWMTVKSSSHDQEIDVSTNFIALSVNIELWHKDPQLARQCDPDGRLATISHSTVFDNCDIRDWIVLPNEIRIVEHNPDPNVGDEVLATVPLTDSDRRKIVAAIAAVPAGFRGRRYKCDGVVDGSRLRFRFSADGHHQPDDVELENTWRGEVDPLFDAISARLPEKLAIYFKAECINGHFNEYSQSSFTWAELRARYRRWNPLPWWCVWPKLLG